MRLRYGAVLAVYMLIAAVTPAAADHIQEGDVRFKVTCNYSHSLADDPIVFPNQPGASHLHDFFGKTGVDASTTTYAQLVDGDDRTTCNDPEDLAAYWVPALYADGVQVLPTRMTGYYRRGEKHGTIEPYPDGLKIVSDVGGWQCNSTTVTGPAGCTAGELKMTVVFPDCYDGINLDSPDHRSHMAYSVDSGVDGNVCPASHPVPVPELSIFVSYVPPPVPPVRWRLSSGTRANPTAPHGDLFQGWVRSRLIERIDTCLNMLVRCPSGGEP